MAEREQKPPLQIPDGTQLKVGIVKASFNSDITNQQLNSAQELLNQHNIAFDVIEVAGCFEIAYALQQQATSEQYDALVALGCLIKGETIHFEVISYGIAEAIMNLITKHDLPIGFGIITANTKEQALARVDIGHDATYAAIDSLLQAGA